MIGRFDHDLMGAEAAHAMEEHAVLQAPGRRLDGQRGKLIREDADTPGAIGPRSRGEDFRRRHALMARAEGASTRPFRLIG